MTRTLKKGMKISGWALAAALVLLAAAFASGSGCHDDGDDSSGGGGFLPWPGWVFEHWVWRAGADQAETIQLVDDYLARDIPVAAVVIGRPWESGYNTFEFDPALFPDPQGMVDGLHQRGVKVVLWINPVINGVCEGGVPDCPEKILYDEALANDYLMGDGEMIPWSGCPGGVPYCGGLVDLFNPEALDWWHGIIDPVLDLGIDGWKCDTIEPFSLIASISPYAGPTEPWAFNDLYYQDFFDYTRRKLGSNRVIMARAIESINIPPALGLDIEIAFPHAGREINFAGWLGEQSPNFDGLRTALKNMYLSAQVGYLSMGPDIGGAKDGVLPRELFVRWAQLGAMCPIMENGGMAEHRPWMIGGDTVEMTETTDIYRTYTDLHYSLIPYMQLNAVKAWITKTSLTQPQENGGDIWTWEYLLGDDILVAPIHETGTTRLVRFPAGGDWVYLWNRTLEYAGGTEATLDFPLQEYPIFLRKGSAIERDPNLP